MFEKSRYLKRIKTMKEKSINDDTYYLMGSSFAFDFCNSGNYGIFDYYEDWDNYKRVPLDLGLALEDMVRDENVSLGIHRTFMFGNPLENDMMDSILDKGIYNHGDLSSGVASPNVYVTKTVSFPKTILNTMIMLKSSYKNSNVAFILCFPSNLIDKSGNMLTDDLSLIYDEDNGTLVIKPEFIKGVVIQNENELLYYSKEELQTKKTR